MLLLENKSLCECPGEALEDLLEELYLHAGQSVMKNGAAVGMTYNGAWKAQGSTPELDGDIGGPNDRVAFPQ